LATNHLFFCALTRPRKVRREPAEGYKTLGERFAAKAIPLIKKQAK